MEDDSKILTNIRKIMAKKVYDTVEDIEHDINLLYSYLIDLELKEALFEKKYTLCELQYRERLGHVLNNFGGWKFEEKIALATANDEELMKLMVKACDLKHLFSSMQSTRKTLENYIDNLKRIAMRLQYKGVRNANR
jgi:hypothetical protein